MTSSMTSRKSCPVVLGRDDPIVKPVVSGNTPKLGSVMALVSSGNVIRLVNNLLGITKDDYRPLFMSRLHPDPTGKTGFSVAGPVVGAPYAVMLLETLIAWGAKKFLFIGWCGSLSQEVEIGEIILPTGAFIDEGTSVHYGADTGGRTEPSEKMAGRIRSTLEGRGVAYREGAVWTTDGIYRETPGKVEHFRGQGALAVEMEISALFTVGRYHKVDVGALVLVSDDLSGTEWRPGFKDNRFKHHRKIACETLVALCRQI